MTRLSPLWFPFLLLVVVQGIFLAHDDSPVARHALWGTDGYMRLVRVEQLAETGAWYDGTIAKANAPEGDTLHWTRPLDVLLLAGAAPLIPSLGLHEALYWWGVFLSPVLHWLTLLALFWAMRPLFKTEGLVYLGVISLAQPALLSYYAAARPDHHSLIGLLLVVLLGFGIRLMSGVTTVRTALLGGAVAGFGLWVSVEMLLPLALVLTALGLSWVGAGNAFVRRSAVFSAGLLAALTIALVVERPPGELLAVEFDRVSVVHLFLASGLLAFWWLVLQLSEHTELTRNVASRLFTGLAGAVLLAGAVALAFPGFFAGPYADVDPRVVAVWFNNTSEVRPLIRPENWLKSLREGLFLVGPALPALPAALYLWRRSPPAERRAWGLIALGLVIFTPLALYQARWATYAEFLILAPYTILLLGLLSRLDRGGIPLDRAARLARAAVRGAIVAGMATVFMLATVLIYKLEDHPAKTKTCPMSAMTPHLAEDAELSTPPKRIMSLVYYGSEIIYRGDHSVVGTPYQRNHAGILDTIDFFSATDPAMARKIADKRGLDLVLICARAGEGDWYKTPEQGPDSLFERLAAENPPVWLTPVALPAKLAEHFQLFSITAP